MAGRVVWCVRERKRDETNDEKANLLSREYNFRFIKDLVLLALLGDVVLLFIDLFLSGVQNAKIERKMGRRMDY